MNKAFLEFLDKEINGNKQPMDNGGKRTIGEYHDDFVSGRLSEEDLLKVMQDRIDKDPDFVDELAEYISELGTELLERLEAKESESQTRADIVVKIDDEGERFEIGGSFFGICYAVTRVLIETGKRTKMNKEEMKNAVDFIVKTVMEDLYE